MAELRQFKLPDVGEGLTEADIIKWHVRPGDPVRVNQIIVEIETAKAVVELPCPFDGVVGELLAAEGTTADVGTPIIAVHVGADAAQAAAAGGAGGPAGAPGAPAVRAGGRAAGLVPAPAQGTVEPGLHGSPAPRQEQEQRQAVLVGYGVKLGATTRRARKAPAGGQAPGAGPAAAAPAGPGGARTAETGTGAAEPAAPPGGLAEPPVVSPPLPTVLVPPTALTPPPSALQPAPPLAAEPAPAPRLRAGPGAVLAKPPVRKMARDLGVDLTGLAGTGPNGSITRQDVQAAAAGPAAGAAIPAAGLAAAAAPAGLLREERIPVRGVRKHTAAAMAASAFTAPHVTEFLQIDITQTMDATARLRDMPEFEGLRVSPLLLVSRAVLIAAGRYPMINSSWDEAAQEIVVRHYVNLGVAAATGRGLVVPSIKNAQALSLPELARTLAELAQTARAGKATPADLTGGTITITNVGVFGVDTGTPILTPGEAAILAFGQVRDAPWVHEGQLAVRKVSTLALSFDHRIVDGDLGSAALRDIGAMLTDPVRMLALS
ncbi:MAG: dihydrolipoamide acetyltransferase family protein [Streptosporangiaceae bacterium]